MQAQFEEQKHQVTTVDVENLQLIDRLHTMSSEIAYLKTTIGDKEKQEEDLHRALEDSAVLESSMRGEIEQQHIRCEELEIEIQSLQVYRMILSSLMDHVVPESVALGEAKSDYLQKLIAIPC